MDFTLFQVRQQQQQKAKLAKSRWWKLVLLWFLETVGEMTQAKTVGSASTRRYVEKKIKNFH